MEGFTKEVLMKWREALAVVEGKCTALKVGRKGNLLSTEGVQHCAYSVVSIRDH